MRRMKLSREGSGCGGRNHHRHRHHLRRILPPTTPPTPPSTASAKFETITINPAEVSFVAVSVEPLLLGKRKSYGRGHGGITRGGDGRRQEESAGPLLLSGGVTGGADCWREDYCRGQRGKRRSHGRGREWASPEGRAPPIPAEDRRDYWRGVHQYYRRGRQLAGPARVSAGVTGGGRAVVMGEARGGIIF